MLIKLIQPRGCGFYRLNKKEFYLERVFEGSQAKCHGRVNSAGCRKPVVSGEVQPGFDGIIFGVLRS